MLIFSRRGSFRQARLIFLGLCVSDNKMEINILINGFSERDEEWKQVIEDMN